MTDTNSASAVAAQVAEIREAYEQAEAEGRFDVVADYVAEDFVALPPGMSPIEGRETWAAKFDEWMEGAADRGYRITYHSRETLVGDDFAVDWGSAVDEATDDGERVENEYNYLMVYRRAGGGTLELARIVWNGA